MELYKLNGTAQGYAYLCICDELERLLGTNLFFIEEEKPFWSLLNIGSRIMMVTTKSPTKGECLLISEYTNNTGFSFCSERRILVHGANRDGSVFLAHSANCMIPIRKIGGISSILEIPNSSSTNSFRVATTGLPNSDVNQAIKPLLDNPYWNLEVQISTICNISHIAEVAEEDSLVLNLNNNRIVLIGRYVINNDQIVIMP